jgi:two-component system sensor histidine kinase VicK
MEEKISKEQKEEFSQMQKVTVGLYDLIEMLINLANVELAKAVESAPLDLNEFFKGVVKENALLAEKVKVHFKASIPSDLPIVMLDRKYANMPLSNLLGNAIKYTPEGGTVEFTVEIRDKMLRCTVKDNGRGIPKSEQDKIFEKQYRASNVKNLDASGNGFGLFIAKNAVEAQGGKIWFESEGIEGKGTIFFIELPLKLAIDDVKMTEKKSSN